MSTLQLRVFGFAFILGGAAWAQVTECLSIGMGNAPAGATNAKISAGGRYCIFNGYAPHYDGGGTLNYEDVFLRDRQAGTTERVSIAIDGGYGNASSFPQSVSPDGRFVVFYSSASNFTNDPLWNPILWRTDVFIRDREAGTNQCLSLSLSGVRGNNDSYGGSMSSDGRYVAYMSLASDLVAGDTNGAFDVFVHDRQAGTIERVSVDANGVQGNAFSMWPSISADGRFVAFMSRSSNLVPGGTDGTQLIFVHDRMSGTNEVVSLATHGTMPNFLSTNPSISGDGRFVAFESMATNLVPSDANGTTHDIFIRDRVSGTTALVSVATDGTQANDTSGFPSISADGRFIAFQSRASNLVAGDSGGYFDVFVRDLENGTTERSSLSTSGVQGNADSNYSPGPSISADGRFVAYWSYASNLVGDDVNSLPDVFLRDRDATAFTSVCDPFMAGVIACPCTNPPSGPGRGCDNSSATGGATLSASGVAYLSMDSLVFTTSGEKPTATSIVMQGDAFVAGGVVFGQGVRCVGGTLTRLYTKTAVGGSITAPDLGAGDPTVSARSATLGDTILVGQSRWYLVYYRDPIVLGGCAAASTFNATQTGKVTWSL